MGGRHPMGCAGLLAALWLASCADPVATEPVVCPEDAGAAVPGWVTLGAGRDRYSPLADGDTVPIVLGPQSGYMIAFALQAGGVMAGSPSDPAHPGNARITFRAEHAATGEVLGVLTQRRGLFAGAAVLELSGAWLVFNPGIDTAAYFGATIRVELTLVDACGVIVTDTRTLVATAP